VYPKRAIPLIIVGRQRSGTRFLTNVLNSFERVSIQGELPNPVMQAASTFMERVDEHYRTATSDGAKKSKGEFTGWQKKREDLIFSIWEHAGQSRRQAYDEKTRYFGYKRPNNEFYFSFYERFFTYRRPRYVFCVRNFADNYLSIVSRWPERGIEDVSEDYLRSVAQYRMMKLEAPGRVLLFNLDDFRSRGLPYLRQNIFKPLRLRVSRDHRKELTGMSAVNRTVDLKLKRRRELTKAEADYVKSRPALISAYEALCE
jgi:hypothetical protein